MTKQLELGLVCSQCCRDLTCVYVGIGGKTNQGVVHVTPCEHCLDDARGGPLGEGKSESLARSDHPIREEKS
jgi:hypothetical protein